MLWLALHLPLLSLEAFCLGLPAAERLRPAVLMQDHRVHTVNAAAAACGIRPGSKRATALALAADLLVADSQPARDAAALQAVVHVALAFTPAVAVHNTPHANLPNTESNAPTVLLDVQGSLRLFGGLAALQKRLHHALAPLGHRVQMAAAPTALGAALLAQWWPKPESTGSVLDWVLGRHSTHLPTLQTLLSRAPVWLLGPGREHWQALQGMGLHTLADLRALPRSGLARRFGEALLADLDKAFGQRADPQQWQTLPRTFESRLELLARAENTDQVLHGAQVLLARLVAWAQAHQGRVGAFTLHMQHERQRGADIPSTTLHVPLAEPALDPAHLQLLLRERLAHITLAAPTLELRLSCQHLVAAPAPNGELFATRSSQQEGLTRLLERLCARLGNDQVQCWLPVADHRPEKASRAVPAQSGVLRVGPAPGAPTTTTPLTFNALPLHRPAWLLPEPVPLGQRDALPLLQGRPLHLLSGPERIETGWWDGDPIARDYFIAMAEDGSLVWVYCGRLPAEPGAVNWFLQGRFA
jgi:protein ImuB